MPPTVYHDLAEFGLRFVTPDDPAFPGLVRDTQSCLQPFGPLPASDLSAAAVLLNQSGKAIVTLAYVWKYMMAGGHPRTSHHSNLGSSMQMDVLSGRAGITRDVSSGTRTKGGRELDRSPEVGQRPGVIFLGLRGSIRDTPVAERDHVVPQ